MKSFWTRLSLIMIGSLLMLNSLSVSANQAELKGISFYVMRVIYPEKASQGVALTVYNKSDQPFLMQSWIRSMDPQTGGVAPQGKVVTPMPFIVTPPLQRLEPNSDLTLRIRRTGGELAQDRESVFYIATKAIPSTPANMAQNGGQLTLAVVSNLKLFYRPSSLPDSGVAGAASQLRFHLEGNTLVAENPTPFWLTFSRLKVGNYLFDNAAMRLMVPPKGQQHYNLPAGTKGPVEWQLLDETAWNTPLEQQKSLTGSSRY
ncbi:fimbrial biogenesis chaperone [Yersinia sp. 2538 StPb PI]|uniref:fimbrial biogenesis chaperone n=1 Tax=Yersinia sp. 2538 StPb PI TaxID=3117405 RepID=UPI003FA47CEF